MRLTSISVALVFALNELSFHSDANKENESLSRVSKPSLRRGMQQQEQIPTLMTKPCTLVGEDVDYDNDFHEFFWRCETEDGIILPIEGYRLSQYFLDDDGHHIISGRSTMFSDKIEIYSNRIVVPSRTRPKFERPELDANSYTPQTEGDKPILVVFVTGDESVYNPDLLNKMRLENHFFGIGGSTINFKSQMEGCSFNKVTILPGEEPDDVSLPVENGVVEVNIPNSTLNIDGATRNDVSNAVSAILKSNGFSLPGDYHHILYCLPPGTFGNWIAYSHINHWHSVFNDRNCLRIMAQMHEIGHNLNLHNAEENHGAGDQSGMMGHIVGGNNNPLMCFNGPDSWKLGWYEDRQMVIHPLTFDDQDPNAHHELMSNWVGDIIGPAHYNETTGNDLPVLVKLETFSVYDYYIYFNVADGYNWGTERGSNRVLIARRGAENSEYSESILLAELMERCSYSIYDFGGSGEFVTISVNAIAFTSGLPKATIEIYSGSVPVDAIPGLNCEVTGSDNNIDMSNAFTINRGGVDDGKGGDVCTDSALSVQYIMYQNGETREVACAEAGGGICKKELVRPTSSGGKYVFNICSATCSNFGKVYKDADFPDCIAPN